MGENRYFKYNFDENYDFHKVRYKKAKIEECTELVYYEFLNEKTEEFVKFYVSSKDEKIVETPLEICKIVNKALKRGYNPFNSKREYSRIKEIGIQRINCIYLFMIYLYRWLIGKIDAPFYASIFSFFIVLPIIFVGLRFIQNAEILSREGFFCLAAIIIVGFGFWLLVTYERFDKKGYIDSKTGYAYYAEKYKNVLGTVLFLLAIYVILTFLWIFGWIGNFWR